MDIDVIIPLYKPGKELFTLLHMLEWQTVPVQNIILLNTEEKYFEQLVSGTEFFERYQNVKVFHLSKREFDHGGTRRMGVCKSKAEIFVMMTQDAVPADMYLLEKLTAHLKGDVAAAYARQIPKEGCSIEEQLSRNFNYPEHSYIKSFMNIRELGIKTYFCSNVCAAYRRDVYNQLGGFDERTIFNEDMLFAAGVIRSGHRIAYEAEARVYHSHDYTNKQQLHRNFDLGVSQAQHPDVFANLPSESEGGKLVRYTTAYLWKNHMRERIPHFYMQCVCKYVGYLLGKNYRKLPKKWILGLTSNQEYWN